MFLDCLLYRIKYEYILKLETLTFFYGNNAGYFNKAAVA
jgi:hypothetical protein